MESLDKRLFLSSSYTADGSVSLVTLKHHLATSYDVDVYLGSATSPTTTLSPDATDQSITLIGQSSGFKLVDKVPAAVKPTGGVDFHVVGYSNGTLEIDAGDDDTFIEVTSSTSNSATIIATGGSGTGTDRFGVGVANLTLRTNDVVASGYHLDAGDGTEVEVPYLAAATHLTVLTGGGTYDTIDIGASEAILNATVHTGAGHDQVYLTGDLDDQSTTVVDFSAADGSANSLGLGNLLDINGGCTASLEHTGTSHLVVVDTVNVHDGGTLIVADPATINDLEVIGYNGLNQQSSVALVQAASTINTLHVGDFGQADIEATSTIGTFTVDSGGLADITASSTISSFIVNGAAIVEAAITVPVFNVIGTNASALFEVSQTNIGALTVTDGGLATLQARSAAPITSSARVLIVTSLDLGTSTAPTGTVDLKDNVVIVHSTAGARAAALAKVAGYIRSAANGAGGLWTGTGLTSSIAAADTSLTYAIGYVLNDDSQFGGSGDPLYSTFAGQAADDNAILVKFTYFGDADLTGVVDITDYSLIDNEFNSHLADGGWVNGDFDYSGGTIDISDYGLIDTAFGNQGAPL